MVNTKHIKPLNSHHNAHLLVSFIDPNAMSDDYSNAEDKVEYIRKHPGEWLGIYEQAKLIAVGLVSKFTYNTINFHFYLSQHISIRKRYKELYYFAEQYLNQVSSNIVCFVPKICSTTIKALHKVGFEITGILSESVIFCNQLTDTVILYKKIRSTR